LHLDREQQLACLHRCDGTKRRGRLEGHRRALQGAAAAKPGRLPSSAGGAAPGRASRAGQAPHDLYRAIVFQCRPSKYFSWSPDACERITAEFVSDAKAANITVVVVDAADDDAAKAKKAEAAGMKLDEAVDWAVKLGATDTGSATFEQDVNGVLEIVPGIYNWRPLLIASGTYLHPATAAQALAEAKTDFPAELKYFTDPR
jgi:hypothetical protein